MKAIKKIKEVAHKAKKAIAPEPVQDKPVPPENGKGLCSCNHFADRHYGPHKNWCNESGCACQEFKVKES